MPSQHCLVVHLIAAVVLLVLLLLPPQALGTSWRHRIRRGYPPGAATPSTSDCLDTRAAAALGGAAAAAVRSMSVYYNPGEGFYIRDGCADPNATAYGYFAPTVNATGWDLLEVATNPPNLDDDDSSGDSGNRMTMFAAGLLEGLLTADRIDAHFSNLADSLLPADPKERSRVVPRLRLWLRQQADWARNFSDSNPGDPLARNVGYLMAQLRGLINGFSIASSEAAQRSEAEQEFVLHLTNAAADAFDILNSLTGDWPDWQRMSVDEFARFTTLSGHCTALVRLLPGLEDLLMAHNTWNAYSATLRAFKHYQLRLANDSSFVGGRQSFGGYPGTLASLDAFYAIDSRLVLLQTTNSVFNNSLFANLTPSSLLAWQRVRAANQLATDGAHWARQFARHNSGTYNNQYMVVDLGRFRPGVSLDNGALTIVEQIPGLVRHSDQTGILRAGYWPSYNVPFHEDIYRVSGYPEVVKRYGLDFSYQMAPRAKILRRDAATVATDLEGLRRLMRLNRYRTDPFSAGDPCKCLCCRGDLEGKGGSGAGLFGCYDAKVTSSRQLRQDGGIVWAISGPTTDEGRLRPFSWSESGQNVSHELLPGVYNFTWLPMRPAFV